MSSNPSAGSSPRPVGPPTRLGASVPAPS